MRAIIIDPFTRSVEEVQTPGQYKDIKDLIFPPKDQADTSNRDGTLTALSLGAASEHGPDITAYCDDNGHVEGGNACFSAWWYDGGNYPLAGRWVLIGTDGEGDSCDLPSVVTVDGFHLPQADGVAFSDNAPGSVRPLVSHWLDARSTGEFVGAGPTEYGYTMGRPVVR